MVIKTNPVKLWSLTFCLGICISLQAQINEATKSRLTVDDFCLCETKLGDLLQLSGDFREVEVEEMDLPKGCFGSDSRFHAGEGIYSDKYPGLIFQEGNMRGYVGKLRLTKQFKGKLPDGTFFDLSTAKLKDVFAAYPRLKDTWTSRDCSGYWKFSNDTVSFYVKIDKAIQPQFPIRESDYLDKPVEGVDLVTSCSSLLQPSPPVQFFRPGEPMFFVDSIRTNQSFLEKNYAPGEFASITVIKGDDALRIGGEPAKNGIIYIFTTHYARRTYWARFSKLSASYSTKVPSPDDADVVYILNGSVVPGDTKDTSLFQIVPGDVIDINVIDQKQLKKEFGAKGRVGVVLTVRQ